MIRLVILAATLATLSLPVSVVASVPVAPASAPAACQEDRPCWTWSTMGNGKRGVYVRGRRSRVIVGAHGYAHLARTRELDTARTPRLRGDHTAISMHTSC